MTPSRVKRSPHRRCRRGRSPTARRRVRSSHEPERVDSDRQSTGVLRARVPRSVRRSCADDCGCSAVAPENPESRLKPIPSAAGRAAARRREKDAKPSESSSQIYAFIARAAHDCTRARRTTDAPADSGPGAMAQQAIYEQMVFPTRFVWAHGGKQVRPARLLLVFSTRISSITRGRLNSSRRGPRRFPAPVLTSPFPRSPSLTRRCICVVRSRTGWRPSRWRPSPPPGAPRFSRWCAISRPGTTSTSSSWMASGATTRTRRSSRTRSGTSTTGCSSRSRGL